MDIRSLTGRILANRIRILARANDWKLVTHTHNDFQHELYDLRNDPGETKNLIGEYEHLRHMAALRRRMYAWQQLMGDPAALPLDKPVWKGRR